MKKHFNFQFMAFVTLISLIMVLTACRKAEVTVASAPTVNTSSAKWVGQTWATLIGTINANNQSTMGIFEYDTTVSFYGHSINGNPDTVSGNTVTSVSSNLTGLNKNTTYHYRLKATSSAGITYGSDMTFTTSDTISIVIAFNPDLIYGSVSDNDHNTYKTLKIGTQTWMAENLRAVKYNDGTAIPFIVDVVDWVNLTTPGYCWYNNYSVAYGAMYNWHTVNTGKLCPIGWHVPSDTEWTKLTTYLGGESVAGNKLKETGTTLWIGQNTNGTNESGFSALPVGYRNYSGTFNNIGRYAYWWSSTEASSTDSFYRDIYYGYGSIDRSSTDKRSALSVRCLHD